MVSVGHNGNLTNALRLRKDLESQGAIFQTSSDSEVILHLIARSKAENMREAIMDALRQVEGSYSLVFATKKELIAARDPYGVRPLAMARLRDTVIFASETCAFDLLGAKYVRRKARRTHFRGTPTASNPRCSPNARARRTAALKIFISLVPTAW